MTTRAPTPDILGDIMTGATAAVVAPTTTVPLAAIVNDGGTQMRAGMDAATITEYEEAIKGADGWPFPPVIVFHDGEKYWLADGFHRVNAAHRSGKHTQIPAEVKAGTRRDAILYAAGANASHGLRRTPGDKRRAVERLLRDDEWGKWSDSEIARRCSVSPMTVGRIRSELISNNVIDAPTTRTVERNGQTYQQNTANIGANRPARLFVGDLKGMVAKWMGQHWQHAWPDNPSHTNGEFWQSLTAWMHENVRETWQEGDLKEAIKAMHYASTAPAASRPAALQYAEVWKLQSIVRNLALSPDQLGAFDNKTAVELLRQAADDHSSDVWKACVKRILDQTLTYRTSDLVQAINNVAEQMAQKAPAPASVAEPVEAIETPAAPATDLHQGAGRTPPPPMTVVELVEDLDGYLTGIPAAEIDQAAKGAQNRALTTAQTCLEDFSYRQADLYRALQRLALQRGAPPSTGSGAEGSGAEQRSLPEWAAPGEIVKVDRTGVLSRAAQDAGYTAWATYRDGKEYGAGIAAPGGSVSMGGEFHSWERLAEWADGDMQRRQATQPVAAPATVAPISLPVARHPQHEELFEFSELFKLALKEVRKWAHMTGEHTEILEAERGLRHLVERTDAILKGFAHE